MKRQIEGVSHSTILKGSVFMRWKEFLPAIVTIIGILAIFLSFDRYAPERHKNKCEQYIPLRENSVEKYTKAELGLNSVDLRGGLSDKSMPYCLDSELALTTDWYSNRISIDDLPREPIDLKEALGASDDTPDLRVIYCIADELFLIKGALVSYKVNDNLTVNHFLDNPSLVPDEPPVSTANYDFRNNAGEPDSILALERDLYMEGDLPSELEPPHDKFSGTVIFAKKINISGTVRTGGYDLVLVADDITYCPGSRIDTSPPTRPSGSNETETYDYGFAKDGYRAGDVLIFAKNFTGSEPLVINSVGGSGQEGLPIDVSNLKWKRRLYEWQPSFDLLERMNSWHRKEGFRFFIEHHVFDIGDEGRNGRAGESGNVSVFSTSHDRPELLIENEALSGANSRMVRLPIGTELSDEELAEGKQSFEILMTSTPPSVTGAPQIGPHPLFGMPGAAYMGVILGDKGFRASQPALHQISRLGYLPQIDASADLYWCIHQHTQRDNIIDPLPADEREQTEEDLSFFPFGNAPLAEFIEQDHAGLLVSENYPSLFDREFRFNLRNGAEDIGPVPWNNRINGEFIVFTKTGPDAPDNAFYRYYQVRTNHNICTFNKSRTAEDFLVHAEPEGPDEFPNAIQLSNLEFARAQYAFAPRACEILVNKADIVFKSISDTELLSGDEAYEANAEINPMEFNRIDKAAFLYASAAFYSIEVLSDSLAEAAACENPFWIESKYALNQKSKIDQGLNHFALEPGGYIYMKPEKVYPYLDYLGLYMVDQRSNYLDAVEQYNQVLETLYEAEINADLLRLEHVDAQSQKTAIIMEMEAAALRMQHALDRIEDNANAISAGQEAVEASLDRLIELTEPPECTELCWADRVFTISLGVATVVADIMSTDFIGTYNTVKTLGETLEAINEPDNLDAFLTAISDVGKVAGEIIQGENKLVKDVMSLRKKAIDPGQKAWKNAEKLIKNISNYAGGDNPHRKKIIAIRKNSDEIAKGLQKNLTGIYKLQAAVGNNAGALAEARTLEDIAKNLQGLNAEIPELQRQLIEATAEVSVLEFRRQLATTAIDRAMYRLERTGELIARYESSRTNAEASIDISLRNANQVNDRVLMMEHIFDRSLAYLSLATTGTQSHERNRLIHEEETTRSALDAIMASFVSELNNGSVGVIQDILSPAEFEISIVVDTGEAGTNHVITRRNEEQIASALCGDDIENCTFNRVLYEAAMIDQLMNTGRLTFELYPSSIEGFRNLADAKKNAWNLGLTEADESFNKKRVIDASARILLDGWMVPDETAVSRLIIEHGPQAQFLMGHGGNFQRFYFSPTSLKTACRSISEISGLALQCDTMDQFTRMVVSPFGEIHSNYSDLNSITVETFENMKLYGTSLRGYWTIDISPILSMLETYQQAHPNYNGGSPENPMNAVETFWHHFRGIEFKVFFVPGG